MSCQHATCCVTVEQEKTFKNQLHNLQHPTMSIVCAGRLGNNRYMHLGIHWPHASPVAHESPMAYLRVHSRAVSSYAFLLVLYACVHGSKLELTGSGRA